MLIAVFIIFRILFRIFFNFESFTGIKYTELNLRFLIDNSDNKCKKKYKNDSFSYLPFSNRLSP